LLAVELRRHDDLELHDVVAAAAAVQAGQPQAAQREALAVLGPGRDLQLALAVERRHLDLPAEHRARGRDLHLREQVLTVALEALVPDHLHLDVEVPGRRARITRVTGAPDSDALPGLDPRRDLHVPGAPPGDAALALAHLAGLLRDP